MADIVYLCHTCCNEFKIYGFRAVNEVGRKRCVHYGTNRNELSVVSAQDWEDRQMWT